MIGTLENMASSVDCNPPCVIKAFIFGCPLKEIQLLYSDLKKL